MTKVSVVMGVYNTPYDYLKTSVNSILNQTFSDFEFIIIDDGSKQECKKNLELIAKMDSRIKIYINDKNMGLTYSLNRGIDYCEGEYIARMDSDDYCDLTRFEKQVAFLDENKDVDMVSSASYLFDEKGIWGQRSCSYNVNKNEFLSNCPVIHPTIMVRKESLISVGKYRNIKMTTRCEDYDLFMRFMAAGHKIINLQEKLFYVREDSDAAGRRKFKYRINEMRTRFYGYRKLKILFPKGIFYCLRPVIVGLLPKKIYIKLKRKKEICK